MLSPLRPDTAQEFVTFQERTLEMKISARNMLKGKVRSLRPGAVNSEVVVELPGGQQIVSVITKESAENLQIQVGKDVYAIVKASSVMIAVD